MGPISIRLNLQRGAMLMTRFVAKRWGDRFPFYYVMEFPKSGGTWLASMIADYLQIPRPDNPVLPIGFTSVIHGHWRFSPRYQRVFYLFRDGRDVVVSQYFRALGEIRAPYDHSLPSTYRKYFPSLFDPRFDPDDARAVLPQFIDEWARRPFSSPLNWGQHINDWAFDHPNVVCIRYGDLLKDAAGTLARALPLHTRSPVDLERLEETVRKYSFERQTGRARGTEVRGAIIRKGVKGDWKNHFSRAAGEAFDRHFGNLLIRLGYERDRSWLENLDD